MGLDFITAGRSPKAQPVWKAAPIGSFICLLSLVSRGRKLRLRKSKDWRLNCPGRQMKGLNMILRKTFLFATVAAVLIGIFATSSAAQRRTRDRVSGPPSLSLRAEPTVIRNCEGDAATVRLNANARANSGNSLRYKWTANGGRISGSGDNVTWDLAGARPGVYQAVVDVDEGDPN